MSNVTEFFSENPTDISLTTGTDEVKPGGGHIEFPKDMLGFTAACAFIIAALGTLGNLLTIFALPMYRKLRTTATAFVINLAVVELCFCVFILPMSGAQYAYLQYYDEALLSDRDCIFFAVGRYTFTQVELQTIVAIAFTRALAVGFPRFYQKIDNKHFTGVYIVLIWLYSFLIKLPTGLGVYGSFVFNQKTMECDMNVDRASIKARMIMVIVEAFIPVLFILVLYIFIFVRVKMSSMRVARASISKPRASNEESSSATSVSGRKPSLASIKNFKRMMSDSSLRARLSRRSSSTCMTNRRDMRVARTIFIIFMMVIICSVPVAVIHAIDSQGRQPRRFLGVHILYWLQYCLNVVVYVLMNRQYREAYVELLAKLLPSWERYKDFSFPWENPSISSKPPTGFSSSFKGHKDSYSQDPNAPTKEYKQPKHPSFSHRPTGELGRLSAIIEVNSSSIVSNDEVFVSEQQHKEKNEDNNVIVGGNSKGEKEADSSTFKKHKEEGTSDEKEHWLTQNSQTVYSPYEEDRV